MEESAYRDTFACEDGNWYFVGMHSLILEALERYTDRLRTMRVLDAGCGTGGLLALASGEAECFGVDLSPDALAYCRRRRLSGIARAEVGHLPFGGERFDVVTSIDVLYHRRVEDEATAIREFRRVLKPGGVLLLHLPAYEWLAGDFDRLVHTRRRYRRRQVEELVAGAGFTILRSSYRNSLLFPAVVLFRKIIRVEKGREFKESGPALNRALGAVLRLENALLRRIDLPFGSAIWVVARK